MTTNEFDYLLDLLNKNKASELMVLKSLTETVEYGLVWLKPIMPTNEINRLDGPYRFYFIKNETGIYVGLVLDMSENLHWYIDPKFRHHGYLTNALNQSILIHLFKRKVEQRITITKTDIGINNYNASIKVAKSLGFKKKIDKRGGEEFILDGNNYMNLELPTMHSKIIQVEEIESIKKQIFFVSQYLSKLHYVIESIIGQNEDTEELEFFSSEIRTHVLKFEETVNHYANKSNTTNI